MGLGLLLGLLLFLLVFGALFLVLLLLFAFLLLLLVLALILLLFLVLVLVALALLLLGRRRVLQHALEQVAHVVQVVARPFVVGMLAQEVLVFCNRLLERFHRFLVLLRGRRKLGNLRHAIGVIVRGLSADLPVGRMEHLLEGLLGLPERGQRVFVGIELGFL